MLFGNANEPTKFDQDFDSAKEIIQMLGNMSFNFAFLLTIIDTTVDYENEMEFDDIWDSDEIESEEKISRVII